MPNYALNKNEQTLLSDIEKSHYMSPTLTRINRCVADSSAEKDAWQAVFDQLHTILVDARGDVEAMQEARKAKGEITDIRQSMKSIAGNTFSKAIIYIFLKNKIANNINPHIFITSTPKQVKGFENVSTIQVGGETQKADCDLIIYTTKSGGDLHKCVILSLKTSLRERAGQTYKWKLLMEIATVDNPIKQKYGIQYNSSTVPIMCFATVNFYNEIDSPQHRGTFKFFDKSFIAKSTDKSFISPLSSIVEFVNQHL